MIRRLDDKPARPARPPMPQKAVPADSVRRERIRSHAREATRQLSRSRALRAEDVEQLGRSLLADLSLAEEFLGFALGAWQHYLYLGQVSTLAGHVDIAAPAATGFSFTGLIPSYILFLWFSIRFVDFVNERRRMTIREILLSAAVLGMKAYTWLTTSVILVALQAGRLF